MNFTWRTQVNNEYSQQFNVMEALIALAIGITLSLFFSFKTQNSLLEAIESSIVAHSASLVHMRSYIHLTQREDGDHKINKLLSEIQELTSELNILEEASNDTNVRFPQMIWVGSPLPSVVDEYIKAADKQLVLFDKILKAKQQIVSEVSLSALERQMFSEEMDEAAEHVHERLMDNIFLTSKATVYTLILFIILIFSVVFLYLNHYIIELKKAKLALQGAVNKAEEANLAKSMFLATMSHEIRTPMNGVIGMTQLLISDNKDSSIQTHLDTLLESGEHLMVVINEILDFSKLEQGSLVFVKEEFELNKLLMPIKNSFYPLASEKKLQLIFDTNSLPDDLILVGDKARIRQVIYNLVGNAIKFTSDGQVKVVLKYENDKNELCIQVSDTGIGIPSHRLKGIFNAFEQADVRTMHDFGGTGLGLSIVKKICLSMGGDITVTSELGSGSCFVAKVISPRGNTLQDKRSLSGEKDFSGKTVLIVEDNRINQLVAQRLCQKLGLTTYIASNGIEAVKRVHQCYFDVILMDHQMPQMGGIEATKLIRNEHAFQGIILGCTADVTKDTALAFVDAGANGVITKPLQLDSLGELIARNVMLACSASHERHDVLE
ncbi:ATP-binding protein [Vibrio cyclitrophicus]